MSRRPPPLGTLTDRVQLQRRQSVPEAEGGHATLYVPVGSLWSRVRRLSVRSASEADGRGTAITHAVVIRFRNDVQPGDRFVYRGRHLAVASADDLDGRRAWLGCRCVEMAVTG